MRLFRHIMVALALSVVPIGVAHAQDVDGATAAVESAEARFGVLLAEFEAERDVFVQLAAQIEAAKTNPPATPFDVLELQRALREAHTLAGELSTLEDALRLAAQERDEAAQYLADEAGRELAALEAQIAADPSRGPQLRSRIAELGALMDRFAAPLPSFSSVPIEAIASNLPDSSEEWFAAADELEDAASRLQRQLDEVRERLDQVEARERLERRVNEIAFEESMFETDRGRRFDSPRDRANEQPTSGQPESDEGGTRDGEAAAGGGDVDSSAGEGALDGAPEGDFGDAEAPPEVGDDDGVTPDNAPVEGGVPLGDPSTVVTTRGTSPDPTQLDDAQGRSNTNNSRSRSTRDLRSRLATLEAELEAVRAEQQRIIERARELESEGL